MLYAVIGANYGDEGKGLVTDYLSTHQTLVVRVNGGAQAGHTVVTPSGQRCVFHQLGSGTLRGADTLFAREFLANPTLFREEWLEHRTKVIVDPRVRLTLPIDMIINQAIEASRGADRHGSCGLGVNETVVRSKSVYDLRAGMLHDYPEVKDLLHFIIQNWLPYRCKSLGIEVPFFNKEQFMWHTLDDLKFFWQHTTLCEDVTALAHRRHVVFEGAQGLRLDACSQDFPHVTNSRTGLTNIIPLLYGRDETLEVYYVTRPYLTRHGAGPLPGEVNGHPFGWVGPETNVDNLWQGSLRYAPLDVERLSDTVLADLKAYPHPVNGHFAVTCLDQGNIDVLHSLNNILPVGLTSIGPTRNHVARYEKGSDNEHQATRTETSTRG